MFKVNDEGRGCTVVAAPAFKNSKKMICKRTDFENGITQILGFLSVSDADIEAAEREVFPEVFCNVKYDDVETEEEKALVAQSLKYFTFVQVSQNRNSRLKIDGSISDNAQSYGATDKGALLNCWAMGVRQAQADLDELKHYYVNISLKAEVRI